MCSPSRTVLRYSFSTKVLRCTPAITTVSHPEDINVYTVYIYFSRTICKKQHLKHHFRSNSTCNFSFFNVLHNNEKAFNQKWHINKTALAMDIQVIRRQVLFFIQKCLLPFQIEFYILKKAIFHSAIKRCAR